MRWLTKLTYIQADLNSFYPLLASHAFSDVLSASLKIESVPLSRRGPSTVTVTSSDIVGLFQSTGRVVDEAHTTAIATLLEQNTPGASMSITKFSERVAQAGKHSQARFQGRTLSNGGKCVDIHSPLSLQEC